MPIIDLQRNTREIGRIRLGEFAKPASGRGRPTKLSTYRFTSQSKALIEKVADLYGGDVREWTPQGGGAQAWEVVSESNRIPILVPPNPLSQWYEEWAGGGCKRRCDGQREVLTDQPCICGPDPDDRVCKPTTRLNVMLRDVEGVGVWRMETHGYYAAVELPGMAEFLTLAPREYVAGHLILEWRRVKRDGQTREFAVPGIEIEGVTPAQLMAGVGTQVAIEAGSSVAEIEAKAPSTAYLLEQVYNADTVNRLREMWRTYKDAGWLNDQVSAAISERVKEINAADVEEAQVVEHDALDGLSEEQEVYHRLLSTVDPDLSMAEIERFFSEFNNGTDLHKASAAEMQAYIDYLEAQES